MKDNYRDHEINRDEALDALSSALDSMMTMYDYNKLTEFARVRVMRICDSIADLEIMIRTA